MPRMSAQRRMAPWRICQVSPPFLHLQSHSMLSLHLWRVASQPAAVRTSPTHGVVLRANLGAYAAELLQDGKMSRAADVYSFAMIMWELFTCKRLYEGHIASQARRTAVLQLMSLSAAHVHALQLETELYTSRCEDCMLAATTLVLVSFWFVVSLVNASVCMQRGLSKLSHAPLSCRHGSLPMTG